MLPRIKRAEFRHVHIDETVYKDNDIFLHKDGIEVLDASHRSTVKDFEKMLLYDPEAVIFGIGFRKEAEIEKSIFDVAKKHNVSIHVMPTDKAVRKFQELARKGKNVVAKLHVTC